MSAAHASIRAAISRIAGTAWLIALGCASAPPGKLVGVSDAVPEAPTPSPVPVPRAVWPDFTAARAWPEAAPPVPALAHRRDGTLIHVRVEAGGLESYRALAVDAPMPDGSRVAAFHEAPSGELLGAYILTKRGRAWAPLELDARGAVVRGDGSACSRCHELAPTDHLFGITARVPP